MRYQPVPPTNQPVSRPPWLSSVSNGPTRVGTTVVPQSAPSPFASAGRGGRSSTLQSCGRSSTRHPPSSNSGRSAPAASPRMNRQPSSNGWRRPLATSAGTRRSTPWPSAAACPAMGTAAIATTALSASRRLRLPVCSLESGIEPSSSRRRPAIAYPSRSSAASRSRWRRTNHSARSGRYSRCHSAGRSKNSPATSPRHRAAPQLQGHRVPSAMLML